MAAAVAGAAPGAGAPGGAPGPRREQARRFLVSEGPGACGRVPLDDAFALLAHAIGPRGRRLMLARGGKPLGGAPPAHSHWAVGGAAFSLPWPRRRGERVSALIALPGRAGAGAAAGELRLAQARERLLAERVRAQEQDQEQEDVSASAAASRQVAHVSQAAAPSALKMEVEEEEAMVPLLLEGGTAVASSARFRTMLRAGRLAASLDAEDDFGFSSLLRVQPR
jgi:hypothetical protein